MDDNCFYCGKDNREECPIILEGCALISEYSDKIEALQQHAIEQQKLGEETADLAAKYLEDLQSERQRVAALQKRVVELETKLYGEQQHSRGLSLDAAFKQERIAELKKALSLIHAPFCFGTNEGLIDFETLAREFNHRQNIAGNALRSEPGEGGDGKVQHASDCAVHNAPALEPGPCNCGAEPRPAQLDQAQENECRCIKSGPNYVENWCPIHGSSRQETE